MKKTPSIKAVMKRQYAINKYLDVLVKSKDAINKLIKNINLN